MAIWKIESNPVKQFALAGGMFVVGVMLMIGFRDFHTSGSTNSLSGFLLGVLLVGITIASIFSIWKQVISVDSIAKNITVLSTGIFGAKQLAIPFDAIVSMRVAFLGKRSNHGIGNSHYISLTLRDGSHQPLFFPAYFDGRGDESVAHERLRRLKEYIPHLLIQE